MTIMTRSTCLTVIKCSKSTLRRCLGMRSEFTWHNPTAQLYTVDRILGGDRSDDDTSASLSANDNCNAEAV